MFAIDCPCGFAVLTLIFVLSQQCEFARSEVAGAFVIPHGGIALDPTYSNLTNTTSRQVAEELHQALMQANKAIDSLQPDIIFLSTPHGIADLDRFVFYLNEHAKGLAYPDGCTNLTECTYRLNVTVAVNESLTLIEKLQHSRHNVTGISGFGQMPSGELLPLAWGEIIPLYFTKSLAYSKVIIFSHPSRRYNNSKLMIPELLHLGRSLYLKLHHMKERVVVVISADLAHTHSADGPYGFSPAAQPFDDAVGKWMETLKPRELLNVAGDLVEQAMSCGFTGLAMLHGMLSEGGLKNWQPHLLVNGHPTYYGMAVATIAKSQGF